MSATTILSPTLTRSSEVLFNKNLILACLRAALMLSLILTLSGCVTSEDMLEREPTFSAEARFTKSEFRDCVFRWADLKGSVLQYHPDGVWIKGTGLGDPIALIVQDEGVVTLYHHWNAPFVKKHLIFLTKACNEDPSLRPPPDFFGQPPRLGDADD